MRRVGKRLLASLASVGIIASLLVAWQVASPGGSAKAYLYDFDPGNIISDEVFFNPNTMTAADIQRFLDSKVDSCRSGYTCLKDYRQDTPTGPPVLQRVEGDNDPNCKPYQGARNESAAQIIAKVAQACGINPQVLLVTLQKEQGLVLDSSPSSWAWKASMGYACPDTGSCDKNFYGLFNQLYAASWQFKQYSIQDPNETSFTYYDPGTNPRIYYHPDHSCGSSVVHIENQATANLYYYTPYQPNDAALAAGYGPATGPGADCASYGNRNFYNFFTDWFGSTHDSTVSAGIMDALDRAGDRIGEPAGPIMILDDGGASQQFTKGYVYKAPNSKKAYFNAGGVDNLYRWLGGPAGVLGYPTGPYTDLNKSDRRQTYEHGTMYYSRDGGTRYVLGAMAKAYDDFGGPPGALGFPVADPVAPSTGTQAQQFAKGVLYWSRATGGHYMLKDIARAYRSLGGVTGPYGFPAGNTKRYDNGVLGQRMAKATVYWSKDGGIWPVSGDIADVYASRGGPDGSLGYPVSGVTTSGNGTTTQRFAHGTVSVALNGDVTIK